MPVTADELRDRTKKFAIRVLRLNRSLPHYTDCDVIGRQLVRSATSVAANYRAACRGRSHAEFLAKICIVVEEADESLFWLELLAESGLLREQQLADLLQEGRELVAIFSAARKTAADRASQSRNHHITQSPN